MPYIKNSNVKHGIDVDEVLTHYITAALWSSNDESDETGGIPMDENYTRSDIDPETLEEMRRDCDKFVEDNHTDLLLWEGNTTIEQQAGHDFWLTRNGHGCGFWESEWTDLPSNPGDRLDKASKAFGGYDLYIGDDGMVYGFGG